MLRSRNMKTSKKRNCAVTEMPPPAGSKPVITDSTKEPVPDIGEIQRTLELFAPAGGEFVELWARGLNRKPCWHGFYDSDGLVSVLPVDSLTDPDVRGVIRDLGLPEDEQTSFADAVLPHFGRPAAHPPMLSAGRPHRKPVEDSP